MLTSSRKLAVLAVSVAAALVTAGCTSATSSGGAGGTSAAAQGDSACVAQARQVVDVARQSPDIVMPDQPVDMSKAAGKNFWLIVVLTNQWTSAVMDAFRAAGQTAGVNVTIFDGQGSVNRWNEGVQQAIAQGADVIGLLGIDPSLVSQSLQEAKAAGIPVVNAISGNYDAPLVDGVFSNLSADYRKDGESLAAWMLADSGCSSDAVLLYGTGLPLWISMKEGAEQIYRRLCQSDCELTIEEVDTANASTELERKTRTALTQNPDVGYLFPTWDSAVTFVEPAAAQIKPDTKIVSRDGLEQALELIRKGGMQKATVAMPPESWIGWTILDELARAVTGAQPSGIVIPTRLVDSTNVGTTNADIWPSYQGFEARYRSLWGLG